MSDEKIVKQERKVESESTSDSESESELDSKMNSEPVQKTLSLMPVDVNNEEYGDNNGCDGSSSTLGDTGTISSNLRRFQTSFGDVTVEGVVEKR